ncbi:MAG: IS200/IS605 family transposase [Anaerorhabdus sp.]
MKDMNSLSHTSYRCKYHIIIIPKYRRLIIYNKLRRDIVEIITLLCNRKPDVQLLEGEACPDHIHMLIEIPPKYSVSEFMGYLKSKSTLMIFDRHANLKYKYANRHFWAKGYFVDTVGKNEKVIREYIQNQLQEDKLYDQMSMKEFIDPFTGEQVEGIKKKKPFKG